MRFQLCFARGWVIGCEIEQRYQRDSLRQASVWAQLGSRPVDIASLTLETSTILVYPVCVRRRTCKMGSQSAAIDDLLGLMQGTSAVVITACAAIVTLIACSGLCAPAKGKKAKSAKAIKNTVLLSGPAGSGKTAMMHQVRFNVSACTPPSTRRARQHGSTRPLRLASQTHPYRSALSSVAQLTWWLIMLHLLCSSLLALLLILLPACERMQSAPNWRAKQTTPVRRQSR